MTAPIFSVLMSVHNGEAFLGEALDSVFRQTCQDFELIVVDDGSTDATSQILETHADRRTVVLRNDQCLGLTRSLNRGLDLARGEFVARMDADDVCFPNRLEMQLTFMRANPAVGVCGTWVRAFGRVGPEDWRYPVNDADIRSEMLFRNPIAHPTVAIRRSLIEKHHLRYDPNAEAAEDYDLWARCSLLCALANLPQVLLQYRLHSSSTSARRRTEQVASTRRIVLRLLQRIGLEPSEAELDLHLTLVLREFGSDGQYLSAVDSWLRKLANANGKAAIYQATAFGRTLASRWVEVCHAAARAGAWCSWRLLTSPLLLGADHPLRAAAAIPVSLLR